MPIAPFIIIIGPSLENISVAYVCVNESIRFEFRTCSEAVEFGVQLVRCLDKQFSNISNHVWETIEIVLFSFKYEHPTSAVSTVAKKIVPILRAFKPSQNENVLP